MNNLVLRLFLSTIVVMASFVVKGNNIVTVSPLTGDAGDEVEVSVSLANSDEVYAFQLLIALPDSESVNVVEGSAAPSGRASGFNASVGIRNGYISLMLYSLKQQPIAIGEGEIGKFRIRLANKPNDTMLSTQVKLTDKAGNAIVGSSADVALKSLRPQLEIVTRNLDYGRVPLGETESQSIVLKNTGTADLNVTDVKFDRKEFKVADLLPITVKPNETASLKLDFTAIERGDFVTTARVVSNSTDTYSVIDISAKPYAINTLTIGNVSGLCGDEVIVPIILDNSDPVNGMTLEIMLPSQFDYVDGSFVLNESRTDNHSYLATCTDGLLKITVYSLTNSPFKGSNGEIGSLRLRLNGKGSYYITPQKGVLSAFYKGEIINVLSDCYSGYISIRYPCLYIDSNLSLGRTAIPTKAVKDLKIRNYGNAPLIINRMEIDNELLQLDANLPLTVEPNMAKSVEISCSGEATGDIDGLLNIYSNDPDMELAVVNIHASRYSENYLAFQDKETPIYLDSADFDVSLANYTTIKGMQFDISYPEGILAPSEKSEALERAAGFQITSRQIAPGKIRYFVYSLGGDEIEPGEGKVLTLPFDILDGAPIGKFNLTASDFVLSSPDMVNMNSELNSVAFAVNLVKNIKGDIDRDGKVSVFDLTRSISIKINKEPVDEYLPAIDMNDDGEFTIFDITEIISQILNNKLK